MTKRPLAVAALLMAGFAVLIRVSLNNLGFWADCWFFLLRPYFLDPWEAFVSHALRSGRPGDIVYQYPMLRMVGFQAREWMVVSCFWLAAASLLCGACLRRSFPEFRLLYLGAPLLVFFSAAFNPLVYRMDLDQGRLCVLFFWMSASCYQVFILRRERGFVQSIHWWLLAGFTYFYSLMCYEASLLLFPAVAVMLFPLWVRLNERIRKRALLESATMMILVPAIYMVMRYTILGGGKDKPLRYVPRLDGFPEAAWNSVEYLVAPAQHIRWDLSTGLVFLVFVIAVLVFLFRVADRPRREFEPNQLRRQAVIAIALGGVILCAGAVPFLLGKYQYDRVEFVGHSRVLVASYYGFVIALLTAVSIVRSLWFRRVVLAGIATLVAGGATLTYDLHRDWENVSDISARMWRDFFRQVPDVQEKTYFLFKGIYCGIPVKTGEGYRAIVFASHNGLRDFIKIAYNNQLLTGTYVYTEGREYNPMCRVSVFGENARVKETPLPPSVKPFPSDRYILAERVGYSLKVVDKWTPEDVGAAIVWEDGATEIRTSHNRIRPLPEGDNRTPEDRVRALGFRLPPEDYVIPEVDLLWEVPPKGVRSSRPENFYIPLEKPDEDDRHAGSDTAGATR